MRTAMAILGCQRRAAACPALALFLPVSLPGSEPQAERDQAASLPAPTLVTTVSPSLTLGRLAMKELSNGSWRRSDFTMLFGEFPQVVLKVIL